MNTNDQQIFQIEEPAEAPSAAQGAGDDGLIKEEQQDAGTPAENEDDDLPSSSYSNIIPLENLRHGWFTMSKFIASSCSIVQEKAIEAYSSEPVQNFRTKTAEAITPAWEKTREGAAYAYEQTRESTAYALEKTQENVSIIKENMQPTIDEVHTGCYAAQATFIVCYLPDIARNDKENIFIMIVISIICAIN